MYLIHEILLPGVVIRCRQPSGRRNIWQINRRSLVDCGCGYPERCAQDALGQNSKAVHWADAKKAQMKLPSLECYDRQTAEERIIQLPAFPPASRLSEEQTQPVG